MCIQYSKSFRKLWNKHKIYHKLYEQLNIILPNFHIMKLPKAYTHFNKAIDIAVYFFFYLFLIFSIISNITIKSKCLLRRYFSRYFESLVVSSQSLWIYFIDVWNILDRLMNPYEPTKHDAVLIHSLFHYH